MRPFAFACDMPPRPSLHPYKVDKKYVKAYKKSIRRDDWKRKNARTVSPEHSIHISLPSTKNLNGIQSYGVCNKN